MASLLDPRMIPNQQNTIVPLGQNLLDAAALMTSPVPIVGDVVGLMADAQAIRQDPSAMNIGMGLLGAMPLVPPLAAVKRYFPDVVKSVKGEPVKKINEVRKNTPARPVKVYHSTGADFSEFDPSRGIGGAMWFTSRKDLAEAGFDGAAGKGRLVEAEIDIRNPAGWEEYDKLSTDELLARGYDGVRLDDGDEISYIAFFPEQVRVTSNKAVK